MVASSAFVFSGCRDVSHLGKNMNMCQTQRTDRKIRMPERHTAQALTNSESLTCFDSEPDFRFSLLFSFAFCLLEKLVVRCRGTNKGVMDRPWTKRRFLRAISSTLKFQFTEHHEH